MAMQWIETAFGGRWVDPTDFSPPYFGDGVEFEALMEQERPHCGQICDENDGWACMECGEPLMW